MATRDTGVLWQIQLRNTDLIAWASKTKFHLLSYIPLSVVCFLGGCGGGKGSGACCGISGPEVISSSLEITVWGERLAERRTAMFHQKKSPVH